jgi:hypothetical protein
VRERKISQNRSIRLPNAIGQFRQSKPQEINELFERFEVLSLQRRSDRKAWVRPSSRMHRAV